MSLPDEIKRIQIKQQQALLKKKNIIGVGYGYKFTAGKKTDQPCLIVLARRKVPASILSAQDLVPGDIDGIITDVRAVGNIVAHKSRTDRWRPAPGGVSIGHYLITAGTLGAIVRDASTGEPLILSNNHVLANSNDASIGDPILQPGNADGGRDPQDRIATLERFIRLEFDSGDGDGNGNGGICSIAKSSAGVLNFFAKIVGSKHRLYARKIAQTANLVDAAVAKPVDDGVIDEDIIDIGKIQGTKTAALGMSVRKSGRTTETTTGTIDTLDATVRVGYEGSKVATFEHQILTSAMSQPGDSGSLLVDGTEKKAVGLLFAGSDTVTVHCPIETVLSLLNITI